jgi:hypothetical protein
VSALQLSVIIVTHNSEDHLADCLRHLSKATAGLDLELIVVDNASDRSPRPVIESYFEQAVVLHNDRNLGFAAAANRGAEKAHGKHLLFLNPDVSVDPGAIANMDGFLAGQPRLGAIGGRLRWPDGTFQPTCRKLPTIYNVLFSRGSVLSRLVPSGEIYTLGDYDTPTQVPALAATLLMIRRELFVRLGGFDTRFFMYLEDTDLCARLQRRNYVNVFLPAAGGVHYWAEGSRAGRVKRLWHHHNSMWCYFRKHLPNLFSFAIVPVFLSLNFLLAVVSGKGSGGKRDAD